MHNDVKIIPSSNRKIRRTMCATATLLHLVLTKKGIVIFFINLIQLKKNIIHVYSLMAEWFRALLLLLAVYHRCQCSKHGRGMCG